jgi:hypothetical protein
MARPCDEKFGDLVVHMVGCRLLEMWAFWTDSQSLMVSGMKEVTHHGQTCRLSPCQSYWRSYWRIVLAESLILMWSTWDQLGWEGMKLTKIALIIDHRRRSRLDIQCEWEMSLLEGERWISASNCAGKFIVDGQSHAHQDRSGSALYTCCRSCHHRPRPWRQFSDMLAHAEVCCTQTWTWYQWLNDSSPYFSANFLYPTDCINVSSIY